MPTLKRVDTDRLNDLSARAFHGVSSKWMKMVDSGMPVDECEAFMNTLIEKLSRVPAIVKQENTDEGQGN